MKKIKVLLLSMLLGGVILADASALTVNAEGSSATTTGSVVIEDGNFSFKDSVNKSFSFPEVDFSFGAREKSQELISADSFTIDFVDDKYNSDGYSIIATIEWNTDEKEFKLIGAEVKLDSTTARVQTSDTNEMAAPDVNDVILVNDTPIEVIEAVRSDGKFEGAGPWSITFYAPKLVIKPNTLTPGNHSATINWTLDDSPQE